MEVQSFILCKQISQSGTGDMLNGQWIGLRTFFPEKGHLYPLQFTMPYYMLVRRQRTNTAEQFSLRVDLVDNDGKSAGRPQNFKAAGTFPQGEMFLHFYGSVEFEIPAPGDYRLDITADEEGRPFLYSYNIEATKNADEFE